ncbi:hypothetical protein BV20DRAFT_967908 [Pilatotrama ljubarskyi]|nr:hypothetical protein BV20DRAFT_967908 [Pilatotrama ljubarskyi]
MSLRSDSPRLSHDVLLELMHHLPRQSDVSSLMRTSKTLWDSGIKPLLSRGVTVENAAQLSSFCDFMLKDGSRSRILHIRKLHLVFQLDENGDADEDESDTESDTENSNFDAASEDGASLHVPLSKGTLRRLAEVLQNAANLEELRIDSCEEFFELHKGLAKSIKGLTRIRRLFVSSVGPLAADMLEHIKSTVVELDLHCRQVDMYEPDTLLPFVQSRRASLEKLSAWYVELDTPDALFPRLRALALRSFVDGELDVISLHRTFPNLQYLELSSPSYLGCDESRKANRPHAEKGLWSLAHLCGALDALYSLGMTPRTTKVEVDHIYSDAAILDHLRTVISEARPSHLVIHAGHFVLRRLDIKDIPALLPQAPEEVLVTHLSLNIHLRYLFGSADELVPALSALLRGRSIKMFVLRLAHDMEDSECRGGLTPNAQRSERDFLKGFGRAYQPDAVRRLIEATSSLQYVVLTVPRVGTTYWAAQRAEATLGVEELDGVVGRELLHREGLAYNDRSMPGIEGYP